MLHSRRAPIAALVTAALLMAAGCAMPDNSPDAYGEELAEQYVEGCTGDIPPTDGTTTTLASVGYCECSYDVFRSNVPYDDDDRDERTDDDGRAVFADYPDSAPTFRQLNDEVGSDDDPEILTELPEWVRDELDDCAAEAGYAGGPPTTAPDDEGDDGDENDTDADADTDEDDDDS